MSEARGLRDKLEETQSELQRMRAHLEKLRAHQARERESLRRELEAARREVTQLRQRLQQAEDRELLPGVGTARGEAVLVASPLVAPSTALVALVRDPPSTERELASLSRLLRLPPIDLRMRLAALPPIVVARLPVGEAAALKEALRAEGFPAVSREVPPRAAGGPMTVRRFTLEAQAVELSGTKGERQQALYSEIRLLMRGRRAVVEMEARPVWEMDATASAMDPGNHSVRREQHGQFLWVLGERFSAAFTHGTTFTGLGGPMGLSRHDSLQRLTEELRQRAPHAVFDDRFMGSPRFTLPLVEEDRGQEMLAELLDQAIQEGLWP